MLRRMGNDELFELYDSDLVLRLHNIKNLNDTRKILKKFKDYLGQYPPSPELAKGFLSQYSNRKPRTLYRYAQMIRVFMKWYGEPMNDFKVKIPKTLPPYTEDQDIERLLAAIGNKKTHKGCIIRDSLMTELALKTGMRRSELANLEPRDVHSDFLVIRNGKGGKDRVIPLISDICLKLQNFIEGMKPSDKVFNLKAPCISMKIKSFAKRAGLNDLHAHTLRHKYATDLLDRGVNIKVVQELLGHENLATTEVYLSITDKGLRDAVNLLYKKPAIQLKKLEGESDSSLVTPLKREPGASGWIKTMGPRVHTKIKSDAPKWLQELDKLARSGENYIIRRDFTLEEVP